MHQHNLISESTGHKYTTYVFYLVVLIITLFLLMQQGVKLEQDESQQGGEFSKARIISIDENKQEPKEQ